MTAEDTISVIIPVLNEEKRIGAAIDGLRGGRDVDVVVVDGGSVDGTVETARRRGARTISSPPGRAVQMNAGAAAARGEVLLFLHADTSMPARYDGLIRRALASPAVAGGAFRFALDADTMVFRFLTFAANFRARRTGVIFGDQAVFARTALFRRLGGFPNQPIMEDYELVRRLRIKGKVVLLPESAVTSARRWKAVGPLRNSMMNVIITWAYVLGVSPARLKAWHERGLT